MSRSSAGRWLPVPGGILVTAILLVWVGEPSPGQPPTPQRDCYKLVKVDTIADSTHPALAQGVKDWRERWTVEKTADGTYKASGKRGDAQVRYHVSLKDKRATESWTERGQDKGTLEFTWADPPALWCSDQDFTFRITVTATKGGIYGGASYWEYPVERFHLDPKSVVERNPFFTVEAGLFTGGYVEKRTGAITGRPKPGLGDEGRFYIVVYLDGNFSVYYHYERAKGELPPQPKPPGPTKGCGDSFAREWDTDWGKMPITLDGNRATGSYTNRSGKFGAGTFQGTVSGRTLTANWKDANGEGTFTVTLTADGCGFSGTNTVNATPGAQNPGPTGRDPTGGGGTPLPPVPPTGLPRPPVGLPPDPPSDPAVQKCIDEWLRLAVEIRNRRDKRDPAPGGPWRVSEYGQLIGHGVIAGNKPEGWETTYRSSRHVLVWLTWQRAHLDPAYGGELPPLAEFVRTCYSGSNPNPYPPRMTLLAEHRLVRQGDTVLLPVWLLNAADVANINYTVAYQPAVAVSAGDPVRGNLLAEALFSANPKESGLVRLGFARSRGLAGSGTVAYVPFRAVGPPGSVTPLVLQVSVVNNPAGAALPIDLVHGSITILDKDGGLPGDCDGDGALTALDAQCALDMSVNLIPPRSNLDMDRDGQVTSRDATLILQRITQTLARSR
jgi:hypothetical protein